MVVSWAPAAVGTARSFSLAGCTAALAAPATVCARAAAAPRAAFCAGPDGRRVDAGAGAPDSVSCMAFAAALSSRSKRPSSLILALSFFFFFAAAFCPAFVNGRSSADSATSRASSCALAALRSSVGGCGGGEVAAGCTCGVRNKKLPGASTDASVRSNSSQSLSSGLLSNRCPSGRTGQPVAVSTRRSPSSARMLTSPDCSTVNVRGRRAGGGTPTRALMEA